MSTRLLFLAANPSNSSQLHLDKEAREVSESLRRATRTFRVEQRWALRHEDLRRAMLDVDPHIVHFAGHGTGAEGIVLEDDAGSAHPVPGAALATLFRLFPTVQCLVLNACYSDEQAAAIGHHVKYVIGMKHAVDDSAAISFAAGFYDALAASRPIAFAFEFGKTAAVLAGFSEGIEPVMRVNETLDTPTRPQPREGTRRGKEARLPRQVSAERFEPNQSVVVFTHDSGLTAQDALALQHQLAISGVRCVVAEHRNRAAPDAAFISVHADPALVQYLLATVKYQIRYLFPVDYPDAECGAFSEFSVSLGLHSTWRQGVRPRSEEPSPVTPERLNDLRDASLSRFEFQRRLLRIAVPRPT